MSLFNQISILRHHVYLATSFGADFHELCRRIKISPEELCNGEGQLAWEPGEETDFWTHAVALTGDPALGLHMAQRSSENSLGMLGMLAASCRTIREAIETVCKYNDTFTNVMRFSLDFSGKEAVFSITPHPLWEKTNIESARQAIDMGLSMWAKGIQNATEKKIQPLRTELRYPKRYVDEYKKNFKTPVLFNRTSNALIFSAEELDTPLILHDKSLAPVFNALLQKKQEQLKAKGTIRTQIKSLLLSVFHGQIVHIDIIASHLNMTTRTLQRKLSEEKTSYRAISSELRKELTQGLLKVGRSRKTEIASLLGYSDLSTFSKALKSWKMN